MKQWRCTVCGYVHEGAAPPDPCPVCRAGRDKFVEMDTRLAPDAVKQWKCVVCGYIHEGDEPPAKCPVCMALKDKFVLYVTEAPKANNEPKPRPEAKQAPAAPKAVQKWKCVVCGYIHDGEEPPERCPVCKAVMEKFSPYFPDAGEPAITKANIFDAMETAHEATKKVSHIKTDELSLDTYYFLPGQILDYHKHPTGDQIFVTLQGRGEFFIEEGGKELMMPLSPGVTVLAPKDVWHKIVNTGKNVLVVSQATKQPAGMAAKNSR